MTSDFESLAAIVGASDDGRVNETERCRPGTLRAARGSRGETLLFHLTDELVLRSLLAAGVDPSIVNCDGWLAHDKYCAMDRPDLVEPLIRALPAELIDCVDEDGVTSLQRCALFNAARCAALLLRYGAAVDAADVYGFTALMDASIGQAYEVAEVLMQNGADPARRTNGGHSSLDFARIAEDERMVEVLSRAK